MQDLLTAFNFLSDHIHLAGWAFLIAASWKISARVTKFLLETKESTERAAGMKDTLDKLATNHFPHMEASLQAIDNEIKGLRQDILTILLNRIPRE